MTQCGTQTFKFISLDQFLMFFNLIPASSISVLTRIQNTSSRSDPTGSIIIIYNTCAVFDTADPCCFYLRCNRENTTLFLLENVQFVATLAFGVLLCLACWAPISVSTSDPIIPPSQSSALALATRLQFLAQTSRSPAFSLTSGHGHTLLLSL